MLPLALPVSVAAVTLLMLVVGHRQAPVTGAVAWLRRFGRLAASILAAAGLASWVGWAWLVVEALALPERLAPAPLPRLIEALNGLSWLGTCVTLAAALREIVRVVT